MRRTKTFKIEGYDRNYEVKELKVKEIISLIEDDVVGDTSFENLRKQFAEKFLPMCSDITLDDLLEFTPSELATVWENFQEVNHYFFAAARKSGMVDQLGEFKKAMLGDFSKLLAASSKQDTSTP